MKKFLSAILVITVLVSVLPSSVYATEAEIVKGSADLCFYDNPNQTETISVATNGKNVWVNAEQLYVRLGYSVVYSSEKNTIMIYNTESSQLPVVITVFHCDDTAVSYLYYDTFYEKQYTAPFHSFSDEDGLWVPFEYSLLLNRSGMLIDGDIIRISQPQKNIVDVFRDIAVDNQRIMFDWCSDFGYGTEEVFGGLSQYEWLHSANYLTLLLDGLLSLEGEAFITFFTQFAGESTGFDVKYGNTLTQLLCINSNDEYSAVLGNAGKMNSLFSADGTLGKMLTKMRSAHELEVGQLSLRCDELLEQIEEDNPISVLQYSREYQRLNDALAHQSSFEAVGGSILDIQKGVSSAVPKTGQALKTLAVLGYALDYFNQDDFSVEATHYYLSLCETETYLPQAMSNSMMLNLQNLESNFADYSIYQYFANNWLDFVGLEDTIKNAMGTQANVMLLAWSLASNFVPFISDGLDSADQYMLGSYARLMQYDALDKYISSKNSVGATADAADLYRSVQLCYVFLKSCYIARDAGIASLCNVLDDVESSTEPLVLEHQEINKEIAAYMATMKNAPLDNKTYAYGFLFDDNATYLGQYDDTKLIAVIKVFSTSDTPTEPSDTTINQYGRFLLTEAPYADHTDLFQVYQYPIDGYIYVKKNSNSTSTSIITNVPSSIPLVEVETADYAHDGNPYKFTIETVLIDGVGGEHPTLCMKFFRNNVRYTNSDSSLSLYSDNESYFYIIDGPENAYLVQESIEYKNIETAGIQYQYKPVDYEAVITESIKITNLKTHNYYKLSAVFDPSAGRYKYDEQTYTSGEGYDSRTLYYEYLETDEFGGQIGTRQGLIDYAQATLEQYGLADRVFSDQSTLGEVKNVLCTQVIGDAKEYNLKTDTDLSVTGTLWMGYPLGIDVPDVPVDTQLPATEGFVGNQTAEQLRKSIVGSWGAEGSIVSDYDFNSDGTCYWSFDKQTEGSYQIRDDKMLVITFPWMNDQYFWTEETYEEWRSHSSEDCWYMTDSGVLILNGVSYYRDGKVIKDYNTEGGLIETIAGAWVLDDFMEYRFFVDGTYEENMVSVSHGMLLSRVDIDAGQIEIIDDTHAKLWNEAESFGELSGYTELVYDPETDTLSIGGSNNVYHRAEYSD